MAELKVGAGKAQIQFKQEMLPTEGFDGIHDLPYAGVVAIDCGAKAVLVSLDLVMLSDSMIAKCREIAGEATDTDPSNVWIHVTHAISTPHEPGPMGPPDKRPPLTERHKEQIAMFQGAILAAVEEAAKKAASTMVQAKMGSGKTQCMLNANRDVEFDAGWWINVGDGPSDHTLNAIRFDDLEGNMVAAILNYDMKPCTIDNAEMGQGSRKICSDISGIGCHILEEKLGAPVIYIMGAAGDQVPRDMALLEEVDSDGNAHKVDKGVAYGLELVEKFTEEFVADAEKVITGIKCNKEMTQVRFGYDEFTWEGKRRGKMTPQREQVMEPDREAKLDVNVLAIGDVAFVGFKPEVCYATSKELKEASPYRTTLLCSMINGGFKYMPDQSSYDRCTWESQSAGLMPGAAEKFVETAVQVLKNVEKKDIKIDFSVKHDNLICYEDGTLLPWDEPHYVVKQIADDVWQIASSGDYHYLVAGEEEAIAIDTGYGAGNLREFLENLCGKPVKRVINTHYHFDHSANDPYFDKVYASAVDMPKVCQVWMYPSFEGMEFPRDFMTMTVGDGDVVHLDKNRALEIFEIGNHTPGGIAILDRKSRILFTGDEIMGFGKMLNGSVEKFAATMEKLMAVRDQFDYIAGGPEYRDAGIIDDFYEASKLMLAGERSEMPKMGGPRKGPELPEVPGHKVYHWKDPHPEDRPGGRPQDKKTGDVDPKGPGKPNMKCFMYKNYRFMFKE